jgi:hypothetical protein
MTWAKYGTEFSDECAEAGLSDAAYRTHAEAIEWLYRVEQPTLRIPKGIARRFAGSPHYERAITELVAAGFWEDCGDCWTVVHHSGVIRESLRQQHLTRARNRRAQRAWRDRQAAQDGQPESHRSVSAYVIGNADRQTDKQAPKEREPSTDAKRRTR